MNKTLKRDVEERERAPCRRRFKTWPPLCRCSAGKGCFVRRCRGDSGHNAGAHLWRTAAAAPRLDSRPPASPPSAHISRSCRCSRLLFAIFSFVFFCCCTICVLFFSSHRHQRHLSLKRVPTGGGGFGGGGRCRCSSSSSPGAGSGEGRSEQNLIYMD